MESFYGDPTTANTSGQKEHAIVPHEIQKWNWGAFFLNWIWGIGNQVWIAFLSFLPVVGWIMPFVLGAKGSEWAWRNKEWESVEHFQRVQRKWAKWGFILFCVWIGFMLLIAFLMLVVFPLVFSYSLFEGTGIFQDSLDEINNYPNIEPYNNNFNSY